MEKIVAARQAIEASLADREAPPTIFATTLFASLCRSGLVSGAMMEPFHSLAEEHFAANQGTYELAALHLMAALNGGEG